MRLKRLVPSTIRGQITFIIVAALLTVIVAGRALERWAKSDGRAPNMETITERVNAIVQLLRFLTRGSVTSFSPMPARQAGSSRSSRFRSASALLNHRRSGALLHPLSNGCSRPMERRRP